MDRFQPLWDGTFDSALKGGKDGKFAVRACLQLLGAALVMVVRLASGQVQRDQRNPANHDAVTRGQGVLLR